MRLPSFVSLFAVLLLATGAGCDRAGSSETTAALEKPAPPAPLPADVPQFNADTAYAYTARQVAFGPRVPNSAAHRACGDWLVATLKRHGATVETQEFDQMAFNGQLLRLRNIVAQVRPEATKRIALAAHWDTRPFADRDPVNKNAPFDGANDGAAPVGQILEIVRQLSITDAGVGVDILFFDGEDYGHDEGSQAELTNMLAGRGQDSWCLGSQYWAKNRLPKDSKPVYGILLDMTGGQGGRFSREELSRKSAPQALNLVWQTGQRLGFGGYFLDNPSPPITDDHVYMNQAGLPTLDIIDHVPYGNEYFPAYHHATTDNMTLIDRATLRAVGQTVLTVLFIEGAANRPATPAATSAAPAPAA